MSIRQISAVTLATPLSEYRSRREKPPNCVGIDGCPGGWVAVSRDGAFGDHDFGALLDRLAPAIVAVDMPIGLADSRYADRSGRQRPARLRDGGA